MSEKPQEISLAEYRKLTEGSSKRQKRGRNTRPDIPAAPRAAPTGLTTLIAPTRASGSPAWSYAVEVARGHRLYVIGRPALDTGWKPSEQAAIRAAKELSK